MLGIIAMPIPAMSSACREPTTWIHAAAVAASRTA
jgi:hypothetical protein